MGGEGTGSFLFEGIDIIEPKILENKKRTKLNQILY